VLQTKADI
jgi:hypothetical protein